MMNSMVTITHNDSSPELLAVIRRKPFATPTASEKIEYLFKRVKSKNKRPDFESYALEHVFSFQRRVQATKQLFMKRNTLTPLGVMRDYWDRTEAQMRAALHAHILCHRIGRMCVVVRVCFLTPCFKISCLHARSCYSPRLV